MRVADDCPISGTKNVRVPSTGDYVEYNCPVCGRFRVSSTAIRLAGDEDQGLLFDALKVAKQNLDPDEIPMISNLSC